MLDTNVVLDIWWFSDPRATRLAHAIETGALQWIASEAMRLELADVLSRPAFSQRLDLCKSALAAFVEHARCQPHGKTVAAPSCSDPDDQLFIDLALACGVRWLFTRDEALLALAPQARRWKCDVVTPQQWAARNAADEPPTSAVCPAP